MNNKTLSILLLTIALSISTFAQDFQRFSPERFEANLQEYITKEANLTPQEVAKFFPIYKEMRAKQRNIFTKQRQQGIIKPQDEAGCMKAIKDHDAFDLELKRIQQSYHEKFLEILPASKVYDILVAEDRFHRGIMKNWGRGQRHQHQQPQGQGWQR
ncbi:MAG: hypothetical protein K6G08_10480 [Prevotella sp.]|nr:hypothetical protein [Prevotella sp.]